MSRRAPGPVVTGLVLDGHPRLLAAQTGGMNRQTLPNWVPRYNEHGVEGLRVQRPHRRTERFAGHGNLLRLARRIHPQACAPLRPDMGQLGMRQRLALVGIQQHDVARVSLAWRSSKRTPMRYTACASCRTVRTCPSARFAGCPSGGSLRNRQQDRPRPVRLAAHVRTRQHPQLGLLLSRRNQRRPARHAPYPANTDDNPALPSVR